jgi:hypothetical protein
MFRIHCADRSAPARRAFARKPSAVGLTVEKVIDPTCLACVTVA